MISKKDYESIKEQVLQYYEKAHIAITDIEKERIEVADFNLHDLEHIGLELIIYINTDRVCSKEMVLLPGQACPEHRHPPFGSYPGKEETFRCRYGVVYLYVEGEPTKHLHTEVPENGSGYYTVMHEVLLHPGDQFTIPINTKHWFKAGREGAVVSEFSTPSYDEEDIFTDPRIVRTPIVNE